MVTEYRHGLCLEFMIDIYIYIDLLLGLLPFHKLGGDTERLRPSSLKESLILTQIRIKFLLSFPFFLPLPHFHGLPSNGCFFFSP